MENVHHTVKYYSLSSYIFIPPYLLTQVFKETNNSQGNIFKHMFNFESRVVWRNEVRSASSYLDVEIRKDQYPLINPTPSDCITGYILEDDFDNRDLKRLPHRSMNLIYGSISSY